MNTEQLLLGHILSRLEAAGYDFPRPMVVDYYVSLKSHPFVILTGAEGQGKTELARLFAEAIVDTESPQYVLIQGGSWVAGTGEGNYFHDLQTRFGSLRFIETLQEAAASASEGLVFFICLDELSPAEVEHYFTQLLYTDGAGDKRLRLTGMPPQAHPVVPPNLYITATVNDAEQGYELSGAVLDSASPIEFWAPGLPSGALRAGTSVPFVGFQRVFQRAAVRRADAAYHKLAQILGPEQLGQLRPSAELSLLLWRAGIALQTHTLHELSRYVANAFDEDGVGLFDPDDVWRNAHKALDSQIAQKVLWRLRGDVDSTLRRDVEAYLDRLFPYASGRFQRLQRG